MFSADITRKETSPIIESMELPVFTLMSPPPFVQQHYSRCRIKVVKCVSIAYDEVVYWKRNLFLVVYDKLDVNVQELAVYFAHHKASTSTYCLKS